MCLLWTRHYQYTTRIPSIEGYARSFHIFFHWRRYGTSERRYIQVAASSPGRIHRSCRAVTSHNPYSPLLVDIMATPLFLILSLESCAVIRSLLPTMMRGSGRTPSTPGLDPVQILITAGIVLGLIGDIEPYRIWNCFPLGVLISEYV